MLVKTTDFQGVTQLFPIILKEFPFQHRSKNPNDQIHFVGIALY